MKASYVDKVFLKGVNQGNIQSAVSSMHVTNSDKKPFSQWIPYNHLNQCMLIINQVVSTIHPGISFWIYVKFQKNVHVNELMLWTQ